MVASGKVTVPGVMPGDRDSAYCLPCVCIQHLCLGENRLKHVFRTSPKKKVQSLIGVHVCVGGCGPFGGGDTSASVHTLFLSVTSCLRDRGQVCGYTGHRICLCVFQERLHKRPILILATSLRSKQTRYLQSLEPLSILSSSDWRPDHSPCL